MIEDKLLDSVLFNTTKGNFTITSLPIGSHISNGVTISVSDENKDFYNLPLGVYYAINSLRNLTEEEASMIIDDKPSILDDDGNLISKCYRNYLYHTIQAPHIWKRNALESFQSFLCSKTIYIYDLVNIGNVIRGADDIFKTRANHYLKNTYIFKQI